MNKFFTVAYTTSQKVLKVTKMILMVLTTFKEDICLNV